MKGDVIGDQPTGHGANAGGSPGGGSAGGGAASAGGGAASAGGGAASAGGRRRPGRPPGRRQGAADTRAEILAAARRVFSEKGFDKATVRGIAREAGVDPALVHHYFDTKEGVFVAAMRLPADPAAVVPSIIAGPRDEVGERVVRFILTMVDDPVAREQILGVMRTAVAHEQAAAMVREFFTTAVLGRVGEALGVPPLRMEVAFSQMFGLVMMRYILRLEPLASADARELIPLVAPTIQRYLSG
ncbi:TetR family transcriptional regulator [Microbispora sp. RL4-1S]|uniref:TetR family transcriptional regulator n=1 Tax=Microbispora oryzae TaxID=2806554 RepID=A0A941ALF9_9ACTN|nr:TetR family transcriptional regulator [Microbispora oryzae]MBP2708116.1 TetR family transcriptional regulator [Microbispora oryzae]